MPQLAVELDKNSYTIHIEERLLSNTSLLTECCVGDKVLVVTNEKIAPLYLAQLKAGLVNKAVFEFILPDGEIEKNFQNYSQILDFLIQEQFRRNDTLIALGGGVVGDLSGFVAASYQRGMGFIQVPTSLLAQVDSSVGGKTAINHVQGKNMIGAFYQPSAVFIDTTTLLSLPEREYLSGFAEIVKYAMLGSTEIRKLLADNLEAIKRRDKRILAELIFYSCRMKSDIVAEDEKEQGKRALLNLGHTFGHAIEKVTAYKIYLHGEAVAIGIVMAMNLAKAKSLMSQTTYDFYYHLLTSLGLPVKTIKKLDENDLLAAMKLDKKNLNEKYRLVLPSDEQCIILEEDDIPLIRQAITLQLE